MDDTYATAVISVASALGVLAGSLIAKRKLRALEERLRTTDDAKLVRGALHGTHAGVPYRVRCVGQSEAVLSVVCPELGRVRLSPRRSNDRLGARLFPHTPFTTGDRAFDEQVQVQTRDPALAKRWLHHEEVRRGVLDFAKRTPGFNLDGPRLKHKLPFARFTGDDGVEQLHARVEKLGALVAPLNGPEFRNLPPAAPRKDKAQRASWALTIATFLASVAASIVFAMEYERGSYLRVNFMHLWWLPAFGLALPLVAAPLLGRLVAARSAPWRLLTPQLLLLVIAGLLSGPLVLLGADRLLSNAPRQHVDLLVTGMKAWTADGHPRAEAILTWQPAGSDSERSIHVTVDPATAEALELRRDRLRIHLQRGALGWVRYAGDAELLPAVPIEGPRLLPPQVGDETASLLPADSR
ncbi:MAG: hypothetical protein DHS20C15_28790 [Planctomycetota bacterium]|nr:MAG: hypothetical protein DHS20C15_28790 [Planctomycetota bacterium]